MLFFQMYLTGSVLAFALGPIDNATPCSLSFYAFVLAGQAALAVGYAAGVPRGLAIGEGPRRTPSLLKTSILLTLALLPWTLAVRNYADLSIFAAMFDPGAAYAARLAAMDGASDAPLLFAFRGLASPVMRSLAPLGVLFWRRMPTRWRVAWVAAMLGLFAEAMFSGAAVGVFEIVLVVPWMLWLSRLDGRPTAAASRLEGRRAGRRMAGPMLRAALTAVLTIAALAYFTHSRRARYGMSGDEYPPWTTEWSQPMYGVALPQSVEYPIYLVTNYWAHGYVGLAECMTLPYEFGLGCGHSVFWQRCAGRLTGDHATFAGRSYPERLEAVTGYSATEKWHTIYPWLASDIGFGGALLAMVPIGFLVARAWTLCVAMRDPLSAALFAQLALLLFYLPANNGRLSYPEETLAFWGLLMLWMVFGGRRAKQRVTAHHRGLSGGMLRAPRPTLALR